MSKNIVFTKAKYIFTFVTYIGLLLIFISTLFFMSVLLYRANISKISYEHIALSVYWLSVLCLFVFLIIITVRDFFSLKSLKQIKLTLHDHYIELEKYSESFKIADEESNYLFYHLGGWIIIWSFDSNFYGLYLTKALIGWKSQDDWISYLKKNFKSYILPKDAKKKILRKFHINIFNLHKLTVWPPRILSSVTR
jgi:hypothetical protein